MMKEDPQKTKENKNQEEKGDETNNRKEFLQRDIILQGHVHLRMIVVGNQESNNDTCERRNLPEKASKDSLNNKKGYQPEDDIIQHIHMLIPIKAGSY